MRNQIKTQLKVIGLVMVMVGVSFAGLGYRSRALQAELDAHGVNVPAVITDAALESGAKSSKRAIATVEWGEPPAREARRFEVTKEYLNTLVDGTGKLVSPNTTIRHIPGQPDTALLSGMTYPMMGFLGVGYGFLAFGALLILFGFLISTGQRPAAGLSEDRRLGEH